MSFFDDVAVYSNYSTPESSQLIQEYATQAASQPSTKKENPMFAVERVGFEPKGIISMSVRNNQLVLAQNQTHVIRINLAKTEDIEDIDVSRRPDDKILHLFQDPTGSCVLLSMIGNETVLLRGTEKRGRTLNKLKGISITAVGWDEANTHPEAVADVLVGTESGGVYMISLDNEKKPVVTLVSSFGSAVKGLQWERIGQTRMLYIIVTTATKMFCYVGGNTLDTIFNGFQLKPFEVAGNLCDEGVVSRYPERPFGPTSRVGWLTGSGLFQGKINFSIVQQTDELIVDSKLYPYDVSKYTQTVLGKTLTPRVVDLCITNFHAIVLFEHAVQALNLLTGEIAYDFTFNDSVGKLCSISLDRISNSVFLCAPGSVFELVITDEDRDVWKIYAERKEWELALKYCKGDQEKVNAICLAQAEAYLAEGKYELAALNFGKSKSRFEDTALKFIEAKKVNALIAYVGKKAENVDPRYHTQLTCISTWLVELYLYRIIRLRDEAQPELINSVIAELKETIKLFAKFLDPVTTCRLIGSYGEIDILIYYCILTGNYGFALTHFIRIGEFRRALELLQQLGKDEEALFYAYSPMIITKLPSQTVDLWMKCKFLKPKKLFPSLMLYNEKIANLQKAQKAGETAPQQQKQQQQQSGFIQLTEDEIRKMKPMEQYKYFEQLKQRQQGMSDSWVNPETELRNNQCLRYLRFCVTTLKNQDVAVHNFLLSALAQHDSDAMLIEFINSSEAHCDLKYGLRLCAKLGKKEACVHIYTRMGLYTEAVELALQMGRLDLAKIPANKPEEFMLKKKLWLRIAQTVITERKDVKAVMTFFKECKVLKIEDILPFFPDNVLIKEFIEEIINGLRAYSKDIDNLNARMVASEQTSVNIRREVVELKNRFNVLCFGHPCALCHTPAESKMFLFFPCHHAAHVECIANNNFDERHQTPKQLKAREVAKQMIFIQESAEENAAAREKLQSLKTTLENTLLSACPFCGDDMISMTSQPFVDLVDDAEQIKKWEIADMN